MLPPSLWPLIRGAGRLESERPRELSLNITGPPVRFVDAGSDRMLVGSIRAPRVRDSSTWRRAPPARWTTGGRVFGGLHAHPFASVPSGGIADPVRSLSAATRLPPRAAGAILGPGSRSGFPSSRSPVRRPAVVVYIVIYWCANKHIWRLDFVRLCGRFERVFAA